MTGGIAGFRSVVLPLDPPLASSMGIRAYMNKQILLTCVDLLFFKVMDIPKKTLRISYRSLLANITHKLEWQQPVYTHDDLGRNIASVMVKKTQGHTAYVFDGAEKATLAGSQDDAAEQAVYFLVKKKWIVIDDINLDKHGVLKNCSAFYKAKQVEIECLDRPSSTVVSRSQKMSACVAFRVPKIVSINYWQLWLQIVGACQIPMGRMETIERHGGKHVCSIVVQCRKNVPELEFFVGKCCDTFNKARNSVAKKVIKYLQPIYGFVVKDANHNKMVLAELKCKLQWESYLAARERAMGIRDGSHPLAIASESLYLTSGDTKHQIPACQSPPPAIVPQKPKTLWCASASSSRTFPQQHTGDKPLHLRAFPQQ